MDLMRSQGSARDQNFAKTLIGSDRANLLLNQQRSFDGLLITEMKPDRRLAKLHRPAADLAF